MSRGPGRLQRQIVQRLEVAPERRLSRRALEEIFVDRAGYRSSNLLRAIRSLVRMYCVYLQNGPDLERKSMQLDHL